MRLRHFLTGRKHTVVPPPYTGISRFGIDDTGLVIILPSFVTSDTRVRFELSGVCNHCGGNGRCRCSEGFGGNFCEKCSPGRYGPKCQSCPKCMNGGTCDDGIRGSGRCRCTGMFGGEDCGTTCGGPTNCSKCNLHGGYCGCTGCLCTNGSGWSGATCSVFQDPCLKYSLHGCKACLCDTANACSFCTDGVCYSRWLAERMAGHRCFGNVAVNARQHCPSTSMEDAPASGGDSGVLIGFFLCGLLLTLFVVSFLYLIMSLRKVEESQVLGAAGGGPNHVGVRREREVVRLNFIPPEALRGMRSVLGIPLKRVLLRKLYEQRRTGGGIP